jgi:hypothetical protein
VNYGSVACWKVRGLIAARHAVWSSRPPRSPEAFPPAFGSLGMAEVSAGGPDYAQHLDDYPALHQPVARGPLPLGNRVNADLLNCNRGLRSGEAILRRQFPLLSKLGPYALQARTEVLGNHWQYAEMGLRRNGQRRIPVIYDLVQAPAALLQAYVRAANALLDPNLQWALRALDHDDEFIGYGRRLAGSRIMTWSAAAPDFHPVLGSFCTRDPVQVQQRVDELQKRIGEVPKNLALGFKSLYERVIKELEWRISHDPSLSPGEIRRMQAEIVQLQNKISVLETFLQSLPETNDTSPTSSTSQQIGGWNGAGVQRVSVVGLAQNER